MIPTPIQALLLLMSRSRVSDKENEARKREFWLQLQKEAGKLRRQREEEPLK